MGKCQNRSYLTLLHVSFLYIAVRLKDVPPTLFIISQAQH